MAAHLPKIVFVTDRKYLRPTLVAMWSVLRHLSRPAEVHFWGDGLAPEDWASVERVVAGRSDCALVPLSLDHADLEQPQWQNAYISAATMGRLFIPRNLSGRVLYLDGDILVHGDVAPLFDLDFGGAPLAACRDKITLGLGAAERNGVSLSARRRERLDEVRSFSRPETYFNAGILMLDCDAIRRDEALHARMEDVERASSYPLGDQDHLNSVFGQNVHLLNPAWNSPWGNAADLRKMARMFGAEVGEVIEVDDVITHYTGPRKPWIAARFDLWKSRARCTQRYRRQLNAFVADFPDLDPRVISATR